MVLRNYSSKSTRPFAREVSHHKTPSGLSVSYLTLLAAFLPLRTHLFPIYDRCDTKEGYLVGHVSRGMAYFEMSSIWRLRIRSGKLSLRDIVAITRFFQQNSTPFTPARLTVGQFFAGQINQNQIEGYSLSEKHLSKYQQACVFPATLLPHQAPCLCPLQINQAVQ